MTKFKQQFLHRYLPLFLSVVLLTAAGIVFLLLNNSNQTPEAEAAWYSSSWGYRKPLVVDHTKVSSTATTTLYNFPMLISVTDSDLKYTGSGGQVGKTDGTDILITSSDGSTKLSHEIEKYSSSTGETILWVKIPALPGTSDTLLYIYFGNSGASDQQDAANVWDSNYKGVWHFPNGTTLTANDSTSNSNNGSITEAVATTGKIDGAASFDGSNDVITVTDHLSLEPSSTITLSGWIKTGSSAVRGVIDKVQTSSPFPGYAMFVNTQGNGLTNDIGYVACWTGDGSFNWGYANASINDNKWHYITCTNDGGTTKVYNNGALLSSQSRTLNTANGVNLTFAYNGFSSNYFPGTLDEIRVSNTNRSLDWVATEYNNQSSPGSFYAYGALSVQNRSANTAGVALNQRSGGQQASRQFYYAESDTETSTTSATFVNSNASLTFTPDASSDYFMIGSYQLKSSNVVKVLGRLINSTENSTTSYVSVNSANSTDYFSFGGMGVYTSTSSPSSQTFRIQYAADGSNSTSIKNARIMALKKHSSDQYATSTTASSTTSTTFGDYLTINITPATQGDYIVLVSADLEYSSSRLPDVQVDVDGATYGTTLAVDSSGTTETYNYSYAFKVNLTAAAHTIKLQFRRNSNGSGPAVGIGRGALIALRADTFNGNFYESSSARQTTTNTSYQAKLTTNQALQTSAYVVFACSTGDTPSQTASSMYTQFLEGSTEKSESLWRGRQAFITQSGPYFSFYKASFTAGTKSWTLKYKSSAGQTVGISNTGIVGVQLEKSQERAANTPVVKVRGGVKFR